MDFVWYESAIGTLKIGSEADKITYLGLSDEENQYSAVFSDIARKAIKQLDEYFAGERTSFDIAYDLKGTSFQTGVWEALRSIPYGETRSYAQVARTVGSPKACRAVGLANNKNPLMILVPCHRVIGSDGSLTGYAAGLDIKKKLLDMEKRNLQI